MAEQRLSKPSHEWEDELLPDVISALRNEPTLSVQQIQARFRVGYMRAAKLQENARDVLPEYHRALTKADGTLDATGQDSATVAAIRLVLKLALDEMGARVRDAETELREVQRVNSAYGRVIENIVQANLDRLSMSEIEGMIRKEAHQ